MKYLIGLYNAGSKSALVIFFWKTALYGPVDKVLYKQLVKNGYQLKTSDLKLITKYFFTKYRCEVVFPVHYTTRFLWYIAAFFNEIYKQIVKNGYQFNTYDLKLISKYSCEYCVSYFLCIIPQGFFSQILYAKH